MVRHTGNNCRCVDLRTGAFDVPPQEILTRDSVTINVDAVVYYQVNILDKERHYRDIIDVRTIRETLINLDQ